MTMYKRASWLAGAALVLGGVVPQAQAASSHPDGYYPNLAPDTARITRGVDAKALTTVKNSQPAAGLAKYDAGALPATQQLQSLTLLLKRSASRQQQFESYLRDLTNPSSPYFHHWLSSPQIGSLFGPAANDIAQVKQWLGSQGLKVEAVSQDGMTIRFSGPVAAVQQAFHAQLHRFAVNGEQHYGNLAAQQIPAALAPVVDRVASLDDFFPKPLHHDVGTVRKSKQNGQWATLASATATPQFTVPGGSQDPNTTYDVVPADFDTIYNVQSLWDRAQPIRGAGQSIAVLERTNVNAADIQAFRKAFLPADAKGKLSYVHPGACANPGITGDEGEAALDAEWAGAAAPDADIVFASCADSSSTFGPFLAALNLLDESAPPPVWSLSYGACEPQDGGDSNLASIIWSDAAAEGITVFVSSGDAGSVACDQNSVATAQSGLAVNGMASTPYNVAVGGTDFNDRKKAATYWTSANLPLYLSAISYIPEQTWNNSCASSVLYTLMGYPDGITACNDLNGSGGNYLTTGGAGGGPSGIYGQPDWQAGIYGSTNYTSRLLPDVSLFSANGIYGHALVYCMSDANEKGSACDYSNPDDVFFNSAGGTSFAAPAMAGIQALVNQAAGQSSGNILPALYNLATKQYGTNGSPNTAVLASCDSSKGAGIGSDCIFNNVTVGDIDEPCYTGSPNCYMGSDATNAFDLFGIVVGPTGSNSLTLGPAWKTNAGYSMATGLGSVNAANLVDAVARYNQPFAHAGYVAPEDFMATRISINNWFTRDGFSDIALVDPVKGSFSSWAMKGSIVATQVVQASKATATIATSGDYTPALDALGLNTDSLAWTDASNQVYVWAADAIGDFYPYTVGAPQAAGWKLVGSAVKDSSGIDKLFWFDAQSGQIQWWQLDSDADTGAVLFKYSSGALAGMPGYLPQLADVNGDGYADIVWTSASNNSVYLWINDQKGGYVSHQLADHASNLMLFGAGDINGDGKTDLIWTDPNGTEASWWIMNGFNVASQQTRSVGEGYSMASIADYDGDGLADILWVNKAGNLAQWQSTGSGFQSFKVTNVAGQAVTVPAGAQIQANRLQGMRKLPTAAAAKPAVLQASL